jgi:hypothetical protein
MDGLRSRLTLVKLRAHLVRYRFHGESAAVGGPRVPQPAGEPSDRLPGPRRERDDDSEAPRTFGHALVTLDRGLSPRSRASSLREPMPWMRHSAP